MCQQVVVGLQHGEVLGVLPVGVDADGGAPEDGSRDALHAARGVQSVTTPIFGGTTVGIDPDGQYAKDLAMLQAYNDLLAQKQCKTFDLEAELNRSDTKATPTPR